MLGIKTPAVLILHVSIVSVIPSSHFCMSGVVWWSGTLAAQHHGLSIELQRVLGRSVNVHLTMRHLTVCVCAGCSISCKHCKDEKAAQ